MTLEDPVEYPMNRIRQTSVNEAVKLDFANGVRSLMRQDPDIILVGEIRDADTAAMAFRAAMTGHQVYSTLHTNSAVGAIPRLLDIGVTPGVLAGNIIGIVAQRLVRRLCPECRRPAAATAAAAAAQDNRAGSRDGRRSEEAEGGGGAGAEGARPPPIVSAATTRATGAGSRSPRSCASTRSSTPLVVRRAPAHELLEAAERRGFVTLARDAMRRVADGSSTIEEISRVVDLARDASPAAGPAALAAAQGPLDSAAGSAPAPARGGA